MTVSWTTILPSIYFIDVPLDINQTMVTSTGSRKFLGAFLCAEEGVDIQTRMQGATQGLFGGSAWEIMGFLWDSL